MHGRSLRLRVTVSVLVLMVTTLVALSVSVDLALGKRLRDDIRTRLTTRATAAVALDRLVGPQQLANQLTGDGVTATVQTADGTSVTGRPVARAVLPRVARRLGIAISPIVQTGDVLTVEQPLSESKSLVLQSSLSETNRALDKLKTVELAVSAILLLIVALIINSVSRRALSPLDRMTTTAREIASGQRGRRLQPEHPDTEIGRTATAIDEMLDALEASEITMRDFLSDASHELRTPIASLQANAESMLHAELTRAEREQLAVAMVRESQRANRLVEDLLAIARLDQPATRPLHPVDLETVAAEAIQRIGAQTPVTLHSSGSLTVQADHDELLQVMGNLLDNAIAAAGPDSPIEVQVHSDAGRACLEVSDHGPGVPAADRERIFERFVRLDPARVRTAGKDASGAGLGLAIVRGLMTRWSGTIVCTERADGTPGARFVLGFPI